MEETKKKLYVEPDGFCTEASILFMVMAIVFRMIGSIGRWDDLHYLVTLVALPVFSGLLFILCLLFFSKRAFWTTVIPVVFGVVFFIFMIMKVENEWVKVGCMALYVVIVVLYTMAFSHPGLKWLLALILLLVFAWHVVIKDLPVLMDLENPVSFVDGMQELSVLGIILSLLSVSLAMKSSVKTPAKVEAPEEVPEPVEEEKPAEEKPAEARKPEKEKKRGWGKKSKDEKPKEEKPAEQEPAPEPPVAEPISTELPPAEIWSGDPIPAQPWNYSAPEPPPAGNDMPMETVIMPENRPFVEPAAAYPLEEDPPVAAPADENGPEDA